MISCLLLAGPAAAQTTPPPRPPDLSVSTVGAQTWTSSALGATDLDVSLAQRLRWTLGGRERPGADTLLYADLRVTLDPTGGDPPFEWAQLRQLAVAFDAAKWQLELGRTAVHRGGPRLVDGVQALYEPTGKLDLGVWAGLAPDLFTTMPALRPGGGPIVAWTSSRLQASLVGEALVFQGEVDRVGALAMVRASAERLLEGGGRLDVELVGPEGTRLADGQVYALAMPTSFLRLDALYEAFSSYRYVTSEVLDPDLQRFAQRLEALGLALGITQEVRDPELNHLLGAGVRLQPETEGAAPRVQVQGRHRLAPDPENTYTRASPQVGVVNVGQRLDVLADGNLILLDEGTQIDGGLVVFLEPVVEGPVAFDGSLRVLLAPELLAGPGWYGDLFVNVVSEELALLMTGGFSVATEPDVDQQDAAFGAFVSVSKVLRPSR